MNLCSVEHPGSSPSTVYDALFYENESHACSKEFTEVTSYAQLDTIWNLLADGIDYAIIAVILWIRIRYPPWSIYEDQTRPADERQELNNTKLYR
jgi:hypothetical protein